MKSSETHYSGFRKIFWPIESNELKKFLPMAFMMFFILFNYSMLRSIKDGLIISNIGAEALSFIKMYMVLPSAIVAMVLYVKLCNLFSQQTVFYIVTSFFAFYLSLFIFVMYPLQDYIHPNPETIKSLAASYISLEWFIKIFGKWSLATFYIMAELWGSIMVSLLFWQFANQITKTSEAKRFYPMFGLLGNFGLILTGFVLGGSGDKLSKKITIVEAVPILIFSTIIVMILYRWMNTNVLTDKRYFDPEAQSSSKKKKVKLSLGESFKLIFSSKYLGLIAALIICYGISINLVEGIWKAKIKELYVTEAAITAYMANFQKYQGVGSIIFMIIGSNILRYVSWRTAAILTPIMIFITGIAFFGFIFFDNSIGMYLAAAFTASPLALAVTFGSIQNVLSKSTKYSLFDSTKEMAYIPLDDDLKTKGKAAVDVVGGRLGKSGGGFVQSTLFIVGSFFTGESFTFLQATPYLAAVFFVMTILWIFAVAGLSREYNSKLEDQSY